MTFSLGQLGVYVYNSYMLPKGISPMWAFGPEKQVELWPLTGGDIRYPPPLSVTDVEYRTAATRAQNLPGCVIGQ